MQQKMVNNSFFLSNSNKSIKEQEAQCAIIRILLEKKKSIAIADIHHCFSIPEFFAKTIIPLLRQHQVSYLFMEAFYADNQRLLDEYAVKKSDGVKKSLLNTLKSWDKSYGIGLAERYFEIFHQAVNAGIKVIGIDGKSSNRMKDMTWMWPNVIRDHIDLYIPNHPNYVIYGGGNHFDSGEYNVSQETNIALHLNLSTVGFSTPLFKPRFDKQKFIGFERDVATSIMEKKLKRLNYCFDIEESAYQTAQLVKEAPLTLI